jgi:NAD/NADP transhydrogenase beta subunit
MATTAKPAQPVIQRPSRKDLIVNLVGMTALVVATFLLFEKTQQTVMLVIGGLILALSVVGAFMR